MYFSEQVGVRVAEVPWWGTALLSIGGGVVLVGLIGAAVCWWFKKKNYLLLQIKFTH